MRLYPLNNNSEISTYLLLKVESWNSLIQVTKNNITHRIYFIVFLYYLYSYTIEYKIKDIITTISTNHINSLDIIDNQWRISIFSVTHFRCIFAELPPSHLKEVNQTKKNNPRRDFRNKSRIFEDILIKFSKSKDLYIRIFMIPLTVREIFAKNSQIFRFQTVKRL